MTRSSLSESLSGVLGTLGNPLDHVNASGAHGIRRRGSARAATDEAGAVAHGESLQAGHVDDSTQHRAQEVFARLILEASPNIVYLYSMPEQRYLYVSPQVSSMLGYSPE